MDWLGSLEDTGTDSNSSEVLNESSTKMKNNIAQIQAVESAEESFRLPPPLFRRYKCEERKTFVLNYLKEKNDRKCNASKVTTEESGAAAIKRITSTPFFGNNNKIALEQSCLESPIHTFIRRIKSRDRTNQSDNSKNCSTETSNSEGVNKAKSSRKQSNFTLGEYLENEAETTEKSVERKVVRETSKVNTKQSKNGNRSNTLIVNKISGKQLPKKIQKRMSRTVDKSDLKNNEICIPNTILTPDTRRTFISEVQLNDKAFDLDEEWACEAIFDVEFHEYSLDDFKFLMRTSPKQKPTKNKVVIIDNIRIKSPQIELKMKQVIPSDDNTMMSRLRKRKTTLNNCHTIADKELTCSSTHLPDNLENGFPNVSTLASTNKPGCSKENNVLQNKHKFGANRKFQSNKVDEVLKIDVNRDKSKSNACELPILSCPLTTDSNTNKNAEADIRHTNALVINDNICSVSYKNCYVKLDRFDFECATKNNPEMKIDSLKLVSTDNFIKKKRGRPCKQVSSNKSESVVQSSVTAYMDQSSHITKSIINTGAKDSIEQENQKNTPLSEFHFVKPTKRPPRGRPKKSDSMNRDKSETNRQIQETSKNDCVFKQISQLKTRNGKSPKGNCDNGTTSIQVQCISTSEAMDESIDNGRVRTRNASKTGNKHSNSSRIAISKNRQINDMQENEDVSSTINRTTRNRVLPSYICKWYQGSESDLKNAGNVNSRATLKPKPKKRLSTIAKKKEKVTKNQPSKVCNLKTILEEAQLLRKRHEINMELENADNDDSSIRFDSSSHVDSQDSNSSLATTTSSVYVPNENVHKHFVFELPPTNINADEPFITHPLPKDGLGKVGQIKIRPGSRKPNITLKKYNLTMLVKSGTGIFKLQNQTVRLKEDIFVRAYDGHEYAIINDGATELKLIYFTYPSKI